MSVSPIPIVRWLIASAALALAYGIAGVLSNELALPTGIASPMFAPAGIAGAAVLFVGKRMLPAVFAGCLLFLHWVGADALYGPGSIAPPAAMAAGATLQAWFVTWLIRRYGRFPTRAGAELPALRRILLAGTAGSVISPSAGTLTLLLAGVIGPGDIAFNWLTWWVGDSFGSALIGPVAAALLAPRPTDRIRLLVSFVLPMLVAILMLSLAIVEIGRRDRVELRAAFDREVLFAANVLFDRFENVMLALDALDGLFRASERVAPEEFTRFADPWILAVPTIQAIGWSQRLRGDEIAAHEHAIRTGRKPQDEGSRYQVFDLDADGRPAPPAPASEYFAISHVTPARENAGVFGLNQLSIPATRDAIERARRSGTTQASSPFHLLQFEPDEIGVVLYRALRNTRASPGEVRDDATWGTVFVSLRVRDSFGHLPVSVSDLIDLCLVDVSAPGASERLAGDPGCSQRPLAGPLNRLIDRSFAGRHWQLRAGASPTYLANARNWGSWTLSVMGLLGVTMLGAFLLTQFDRQRRFALEVETRTRELAHEIREREAAELASRAKGEFLSRMSHELRTPLNSVLGFAQLLAADPVEPLSAVQRERIALIEKAGWHLRDMIDEVLDLTQIEAGALKLEIVAVDPAQVLAECRALIAAEAAQRRITLEPVATRSLETGRARVLADPVRLRQILLNLLGNAVKYNREGGSVRLAIARRGEREIAISIADTGPGLSARQIERLFVPFDRLGRERSSPGTGIGLVISRQLAESMGGGLEVSSLPGQGSVFTLVMPALQPTGASGNGPADAPRAGDAPEDAPEDAPGDHVPAGRKARQARILCIEDNPANAALFRNALAAHGGIALEILRSAAEGLAALRARAPELLVLDLNLPDRDGLEVLAELRADPALAGLPVVVVSADATETARRRAIAAGANAFLTKPIDLPAFARQLAVLLEERPAG